MSKRLPAADDRAVADHILDAPADTSILDVLDHVLNKGVVATGDVTLGVAGIDLIYLRLSALLCAADRVMPPTKPGAPGAPRRFRRRRR
jgi:hypothetical protein